MTELLEAAMCAKAHDAFLNGDLDECLECLKKLNGSSKLNQRKRDINWALVSFCKSNWCQMDQFRAILSRMFPEDVFSLRHNAEDLRSHTILFYNFAVMAFHSGQYKSCMQYLDCIPTGVDPSLTVSASFLRIETYLLLSQAEKALTCIEDLEALQDREEQAPGDEEFWSRLQMFRARAYLMLRRFRAYKNYAKSLELKQPWKEAVFRAHLECMNSPHPDIAVRMLAQKQPEGRIDTNPCESFTLIFENVLGCVHGKIGKWNLAAVHFQRAISEASKFGNSRSLFTCPQPWTCSLVHNLGIAFLHAGQFRAAFDCLLSVIQVFNRNPRLWLRIAECCIMAHKSTNETSFRLTERKREIVKQVVGYGPHRKAILRENIGTSETSMDPSSNSGAIPDLSLEFASLCLRNAYALLPVLDEQDLEAAARSLENDGEILEGRFPVYQAMPGSPLSLTEVHRLRCSILCACAYVYLCLGETQLALDYAMKLKNLPFVSPTHTFLCNLYAAEACILLEEWNLAYDFLDPSKVDRPLSVPELWSGHRMPSREWFPSGLLQAQGITIFNLSVCLCLKKEFGRSFNYLESLPGKMDMPIQAVMMGLYLQLQTGQDEAAREYVKQLLVPNLSREKNSRYP